MALSYVTAGESHGPGLTVVITGLPAGLEVDHGLVQADLARRQAGYGRSPRQQLEQDDVEPRGGLRHGRTLGSPLAFFIQNRDHKNWTAPMSAWPVDEAALEEYGWRGKPVTLPRPGHADLAGVLKYGHEDVRNVLERASARETAARVAAGALARQFLAAVGVTIRSHVTRIAGVDAPAPADLGPADFDAVDDDPVRCLDPAASAAMIAEIDRLRKENESLGGTFEARAWGLVPGLGSYVSWSDRLDGRIAQAMVSIQSVKGVSIGPAWEVAASPGSEAHDEIFHESGRGYYRETNRAGGLEGGMTNGETLIVQVAIKPISTLTKPLRSVDVHTKEPQAAHKERTDSTVVPAAGVVGEAMLALIVARAYREKFGGDHIDDVRAAIDAYRQRIDG